MKKIEKLDKYFLAPRLQFYGGFVYDGENIDLCDDFDEDEDYKCHVRQIIEDNILKTNIEKEYKMKNGKTVQEKSNLEIELEKDCILVYIEGQGYVIPEYNMLTLDNIISQYELMRGDNNDIIRNEEESVATN